MAYGDYSGPDLPGKGVEGQRCNRSSCQAFGAIYYNHGSHSWYCKSCADDIGQDAFNKRDWDLNYRPKYGHAMFETREEIDERKWGEEPEPYVPEPYSGRRGQYDRLKPQSASLARMLRKRKGRV